MQLTSDGLTFPVHYNIFQVLNGKFQSKFNLIFNNRTTALKVVYLRWFNLLIVSDVMFSWSEPMKAPADLEIGDEQWEATEEKLQCLVSDRLPRAPDLPAEAPPAIEPLYQPVNDQPISE